MPTYQQIASAYERVVHVSLSLSIKVFLDFFLIPLLLWLVYSLFVEITTPWGDERQERGLKVVKLTVEIIITGIAFYFLNFRWR